MNPNIIAVLCAAGFVLLFALLILRENRKQKRNIERKVRRIYGNVPEQEYETGDIERISHYFRRREKEGFTIDDITWNDLDMDRVYMLVNQTVSSPGEDVLYDMMRRPVFSEEELRRRDNLIEFFASHEKERVEMQLCLFRVGKTRLGSLSDTVLALKEAPTIKTGVHVAMLIVILLTLFVVIPLAPLQGMLVFLVLCIGNVSAYYAGKSHKITEIYMDCFSNLLGMLKTADEMKDISWKEVEPQMKAIREARKIFSSLRKKAVFVTGSGKGFDNFLDAFLDYVRMITHIDFLAYNSVLRETKDKADVIMSLIDNMGELDAAISIASFRELLPLKCKPEFVPYTGQEIELNVEDLYHPLIQEPVANSIAAKGGTLVTGSNASGKSTFLKNMAINAILAQTLYTCTAGFYRAPFLKVMTSMALRDDIGGGDSYFIVEIKSLKRILDESKKEEPLLCIIDEVLRGTNTIERIAASSRILSVLHKRWILPFAATHDIELSYILKDIYMNYHFEEEIEGNQVIFNYLLKEGMATTRNAIRLLDMLGYEKEVVKEASQAAADFERTGVWGKIKNKKGE